MAAMQPDSILSAVERYYSTRFEEFGASARGVDWNSEETQELRFDQLARLLRDDDDYSVNDLGCGYGAFATYLVRRGSTFTYTGYELSEAMLEHARESFEGLPDVRFQAGTSMASADYSVASGIFNVKLAFGEEEWGAYVDATLDALAGASRKGFAFNMLTAYSDVEKRRDDLHYADPLAVFDRCKRRYASHVALLHDYPLWEFTTVVRLQ
jgi:SAM-dependent methyltransferase